MPEEWITVRLPHGLKSEWKEWCRSRGVTSSEGWRQVVAGLLEKDTDLAPLAKQKVAAARHIRIRLTKNEVDAVDRLRGTQTTARFFLECLHRTMDGQVCTPEQNREFLASLDGVQFQIVGMARNLNQVAAGLNSCRLSGESFPSHRLGVLREIEMNLLRFVADAQAVLCRFERRHR